MTEKENGTLQDQLVSVLAAKKKNPEQEKKEKKELEKLHLQYTENKKKLEKLFKIFKAVHDIGDEVLDEIPDEDVKKKFDENIDLIVEKVDEFVELEFIDERTSSMKIIVKQNDLLWEIKELMEETTEIVDADILPGAMPDIKENDDKVNKKTTMEKSETNGLVEDENESNEQTIKSLLNKFDETIERAKTKYPKNAKIGNMANITGDKVNSDRGVLKAKDTKAKEMKVKKLQTYVTAVISQLEDEMQRADAFVSLVKEFGRTGKVHNSIDGDIEINKYNVQGGEGQVTYTQSGKEHTVSVEDFRALIADIKNQNRFPKFEVNEKEISDDIDNLFISDEIEEYIGTGKSKKVQERRDRIEKYKKEIVESIVEIENVARRTINRRQFALDYTHEKRVSKVVEILEGQMAELAKQVNIDFDDIQKTRNTADITFAQMNKYDTEYKTLNASNVEEGDEKFKQVTREVWKEFAVRGYVNKNKKTGKIEVTQHKNKKFDLPTNTDGKMSLRLLEMAGINISDVTYVAPGEYDTSKINIDTGKKDGLVILDDGTVIIDHHGEDSARDTSGTEVTYDILVRLGLLEKSESLDNLVEFVNQVDNLDYPDQEKYFDNYFKNSWKTMLGLYRQMDSEKMVEFFKYGENEGQKRLSPTEVLSPGLMSKFGLDKKKNVWDDLSITEKQKDLVEKRFEALKKMKEEGFIVESDRYGKICVDVVNQTGQAKVNNDSARAFGCDTYIIWNEADNHFFMSSLVGKEIEDEFAQGKKIRGTMYIKSRGTDEKLMQLRDILDKMTDGKLEISDKLEEVLENNGKIEKKIELSPENEKKLEAYVKYVRKSVDLIDSMDYKKYKITGEKASAEKERLKTIVWKQLERDIIEGRKFKAVNSEDVVNLIKDKIEKL